MAGIPKRAAHVAQALTGKAWTIESLATVKSEWIKDFTPIDDMRASADYRIKTAHNLLIRYFHDLAGAQHDLHEVMP